MALAPFFERVYGALGAHLAVSRESLQSVLAGLTVGIECTDEDSLNARWIAEMAVNIAARLYPKLAIRAPDGALTELRTLAQSINPAIELVESAPPAFTIRTDGSGPPESIGTSVSGWVAIVGSQFPMPRAQSPNPYASAAAAALGCAALFRRIFLRGEVEPNFAISLLNFDDSSGEGFTLPSIHLPNVWFAGVGAVGNAALWALSRHAGLSGRITLLDPEVLSLLNLQRYVLGSLSDVGQAKTTIGARSLAGQRVIVESVEETLETFASRQTNSNVDTVVVTVDNIDGRRTAQALLPRLVINGWTGEQALGVSWHVFSNDAACLACLYHPNRQGSSAIEQAANALGLPLERAALLWVTRQPLLPSDVVLASTALGVGVETLQPWVGKPLGDLYTDAVCGAVPLDVRGVGRLETVPLAHQSVLAGAMAAAELVKRVSPQLTEKAQSETLVSYDDVLRPPPPFWRKPRARERGCICGDGDYQATYLTKWRYASGS